SQENQKLKNEDSEKTENASWPQFAEVTSQKAKNMGKREISKITPRLAKRSNDPKRGV
ncbi:10968_t:CDS:2, partial [Racocetra persica]